MESKTGSSRALLPAFLESRPVLLLLLFTPGIPEYLSSSSALNAIILNPPLFLFQLLANLGLYGSGALLIHDARIIWKKGWATVLILGGAYGILEEGVALSTLFDPKAGPVGSLGTYGHWLGVNWVWAAGIVPFHAIFSISIPILLLGLAIPETRAEVLLSSRGIYAALLILATDVLVLMAIVWHVSGYWMGTPILAFSLLSIGALILASRRVPLGCLRLQGPFRRPSNRRLALVGASFFPAILLTEGFGSGLGIPSLVDFVLVILVQVLYLLFVRRTAWNSKQGEVSLNICLLIPIAPLGFLAELPIPFTLLADAALNLFFRRLWTSLPPSFPTSDGQMTVQFLSGGQDSPHPSRRPVPCSTGRVERLNLLGNPHFTCSVESGRGSPKGGMSPTTRSAGSRSTPGRNSM